MAEKNKLRKYVISYYTEVNDECVDREIEVEAIKNENNTKKPTTSLHDGLK